jgi:hypothetical protein
LTLRPLAFSGPSPAENTSQLRELKQTFENINFYVSERKRWRENFIAVAEACTIYFAGSIIPQVETRSHQIDRASHRTDEKSHYNALP